jgi:hypothetical protein
MRKTFFVLILLLSCGRLSAESLTVTTYYPAPFGGYVSLLATMDAIFARDGGKVTVGSPGASADRLVAYGNSRFDDVYVKDTAGNYVKFPRPPAGKQMYWEQLTLGAETDSYQAVGGEYTGAPNTDTCDGNTVATYTCPNGVKKTCLDVKRTQAQNCNWGGWIQKHASNFQDTCNSQNHPYDTCDKTCLDRDCVDWLGNLCVNWSYRYITFYPTKYQNVNVICNTIENVMVLVAK